MLDDLKAFVTVVEKTSLTKAADALSLTQSAVSRRIQQLEEVLGATLLDRSTKPPTATAVGRRIYQSAIPLLRDLVRLGNIVKEDAEPTGTFRLGLTQVVADIVMFDVAMHMKSAFPALDLRSRTAWSTSLQRELEGGDIDAAALMLPFGGALPVGLQGQAIATLDVLIVQSRQKPIVSKRARLADLSKGEWILNPQGCGYRAALQRAFENTGKELRLGVDTHGTEIQLRLVAAGLGLGLAPRSLLSRSAYADELVVVESPEFSLKLDIWLAHANEVGNFKRAIDVLATVLVETFSALISGGYPATTA